MNAGAALAFFRALEAKTLEGNSVESLNIVQLRAKMKMHPLIMVNFGGNLFGDQGLADFWECVQSTGMRLEAIDFSGNKISEKGVEMSLVPLIEAMGELDELKIGGNKIGAKGVVAVCHAMLIHDSVVELDVSGCEAGHGAGIALGDLLKHTSRLKMLTMGWNCVSADDASHFFLGVAGNESLEFLDARWVANGWPDRPPKPPNVRGRGLGLM